MRRELSAWLRGPVGEGAAWPVVEILQRDGICVGDCAGAGSRRRSRCRRSRAWLGLAHELGVVGVLAVELFETTQGALLINRLAMRPHLAFQALDDGRRDNKPVRATSQAVLDYPLRGNKPARSPVSDSQRARRSPAPAMTLDEQVHHLFARMPDARPLCKREHLAAAPATSTS